MISSFSQNGELVCTNLQPGTLAFVEWAPSVEGPWTNTWAGLNAVTVDAEGTIRVSVPMFYRVLGVAHQTNTVVLIPPGSFTMGNCMDPGEGWDDELPVHSVYVSAFYMDRYEVTKALWDEVKGWNGGNGYSYDYAGSGKAANHPVHSINWYDAVKWCNARSQKEGFAPCYYTDAALTVIYKTGQVAPYVNWNANGYRLPTEAEWEKAARGGVAGHRFPWSDTDTIQHSRGNYESVVHYSYDTSPTRGFHPTFNDGVEPYSSPVGYFAANGYGLYDMAGNMWEWCWDWYSSSYYSSSPGTDPRGPSTGSIRAFRGGAWNSSTRCCRVAERDCDAPPSGGYLPCGFRSVRAAGQ
ncbi:MAG: SUMF1/EgtB/PvdO family nonheme iron enzyme [Verrucomicrobia bacterium]|nr:SUMF1/EgtB/PvdO family nonheme iron enzyme [Verrucomicrobiota bacterium]